MPERRVFRCPRCGQDYKPIAGKIYHKTWCPKFRKTSKDPYVDPDGRDITNPEVGE